MRDFSKKYLDIIKNELAGLNLTRILDDNEFYYKQIEDSVKPALECESFNNSLNNMEFIVDIGFGGGFPIVPLAKTFPEKKFIGIEARKKKVKAVNYICEKLGIRNVKLIHGRAEMINIDIDATIVLKAVGKIEKMLELINISSSSQVFFYKGPIEENYEKSLKDWVQLEEKDIDIFNTDKRRIVAFKPKNVPHGTSRRTNLKNLSDLI